MVRTSVGMVSWGRRVIVAGSVQDRPVAHPRAIRQETMMDPTWTSILPAFVAIALAFATRRVVPLSSLQS